MAKPRKKKIRRWVLRMTIAFVLLFVLSSYGFYKSVEAGYFGEIPTEEQLKKIRNAQASTIYSSDSILLRRYYLENRTEVDFTDISPDIVSALIATEDVRFYEHEGVDSKSMLRVLVKSILMGNRSSGGGSTISQQLIKNLYGRERHGWLTMPINKTKEAIVAQRLERVFSKEDVLTLYLNTVSFGENTFGIETASLRFFNKEPDEVSLEEAALLVGLLKAPTSYNPRLHPEASKKRRNVVLHQLKKYTPEDSLRINAALEQPLRLNYQKRTRHDGLAPHFREFLRIRLEKWIADKQHPDGTPYDLYTDGLKIYTTLHPRVQKHAEDAVLEHLATIQPTFERDSYVLRHSRPDGSRIKQKALGSLPVQKLIAQGLTEEDALDQLSMSRDMSVFSYKGTKTISGGILDSLAYYQRFLHVGFMVMQPSTGHILAWVGSGNHEHFPYDHVSAKRQVGSTFKPFVYLNALEQGVEPCKYIKNKPPVFPEHENWSPSNADGHHEGFYSMEGGLTNSVNTISVRLLDQGGIENTIELAHRLGISDSLPEVPSLALGVASLSLYEMLGAYLPLANAGIRTVPQFVTSIQDQQDSVLYQMEAYEQNVVAPRLVRLLTHMMEQVVNKGTATRLRSTYGIQEAIAGKTGTTQNGTDGWFIGFTPSLLAGVWAGADDPQLHFSSGRQGQGAYMALPVWGLWWNKMKNDPSTKIFVASTFPELTEEDRHKLSCEPFREHRKLNIQRLFHKNSAKEKRPKKEKKGFGTKLFNRRD